jgi:hypothetical protein
MSKGAISREEFEKMAEANGWIAIDPGTTDCPINEQPVRLDKPGDAAKEFDREKYKAEMMGRLIATSHDLGEVKPDNDPWHPLATYNHAAGTFTVTLRAEPGSKWAAAGGSPLLESDKELSSIELVFVAARGEDRVITAPRMVPFYVNRSANKFTVKVDPQQARQWTENGVKIKMLGLEKFKKIGFHKSCLKVCKEVSARVVDCPPDPENQGFGKYYVTEALGFELYMDGKMVAEKQPL